MMRTQDVSMVIYLYGDWLFVHGATPSAKHFHRTETDFLTPE